MGKDDITTINDSHFHVKAHCDIEGESALHSLWIEIPDHCQLQCSYCFANTCRNRPHSTKNHLSTEEYLALLDDFRGNGGKYLGIPGNGEPFHPGNRQMVMAILNHADRIGLRTTIFTTGEAIFWEMDPEKTYEENLSAGPDFTLMDELVKLDVIFLIKFNSDKEDVQNALVGQNGKNGPVGIGYYAARKKAMAWLIERYGLAKDEDNKRLGIVTSIMPENRDEIPYLYRYAKEGNLIFDCDTILPRGRGKSFLDSKNRVTLSDKEYQAIYTELDDIAPEKLCTGGSYVGVACDRIKHHLYIDIKGDVYTCIGCVERGQDLVLGNIRKQNLETIWNTSIRVQMREHLDEIVFGTCSYCANFQNSCWSCLGRSVERFELKGDKLFIHTKGCFNHRPDWSKWLQQCERLTRTRVANIPKVLRETILDQIRTYGLEEFWQRMPEIISPGAKAEQFPAVRKDISFSDLNFPTRKVWQLVDVDNPVSKNDYLQEMETLLPRISLYSLKLISETYDKPFKPSKTGWPPSELGTTQFTNLMFYLPHKERYMYRTVSQNSLDPHLLERPEYQSFISSNMALANNTRRDLLIRNRKVIIWQRWAETFHDGKRALILPYIKNLSQQLEDERIDTYELILSEKLYQDNREWIDADVQHHDLDILAVYPLLKTPMIQRPVTRMHEIIQDMVSDDSKWKESFDGISDYSFAYSQHKGLKDFGKLESAYKQLAEEGFYSPEKRLYPRTQLLEMETQLRKSLNDILVNNLVFFADSTEKSWYGGNIKDRLKNLDWFDFYRILGEPNRLRNKWDKKLPGILSENGNVNREVMVKRAYNPLLLQIIRLFVKKDGSLEADWLKGINYFIWLSFFKEYLGVQSYFVHHAHNLRRHFNVFLGNEAAASTPSGLIVCTNGRLPLQARFDYRSVFSQIMNPMEELIQGEFASSEYAKAKGEIQEAVKVAEARKMALGHYGHTLKHRLDTLNAFLDVHGTPAIKMRKDMLRDLTLILQLNTLDNRKELLERLPAQKQERFLDIEGRQGVERQLDLIQRIKGWQQLVGGQREFLIIDPERSLNENRLCEALLETESEVMCAPIGLHLEASTPDGQKNARLKEAIYRELVFELLNNAMRYGAYEAIYDPTVCGDYRVRVWVNVYQEVIADRGEEKHLLVFGNEVQAGKATDSFIAKAKKVGGWQRWPESKKYDGPGMSVDLFRRLELGDMFYLVEEIEGHTIYRVGLYFEGMELDPTSA